MPAKISFKDFIMEFIAFEKGIHVNGRTIYSVIDGFGAFKSSALRILKEAGIGETNSQGQYTLTLNKWYSQEAWLRAFKTIAEKLGAGHLKAIGYKIPQNAEFPPWVVDIHSAIKSINIAYHLNHSRNGSEPMFNPENGSMREGIGHYGYDGVAGQKKIVSVCANPYPSAFDHGILESMATKFEPTAKVILDESKPMRSKGADSDTFIVTWM